MVFDKQVHADEFKLRLLLTDGCNKNCKFCLNDFQPKPKNSPAFLETKKAIHAILAYVNLSRDLKKQVYFSGGEPTLHPDLVEMLNFAKSLGCRVTLNTNGSYSEELEESLRTVDCMHFGVYEQSEALAERIAKVNGTLQCVYSSKDPYVTREFIEFYMKYGIRLKIFGDMNEDPAAYEAFAKQVKEWFPNYPIDFRFIGIQQNRGVGCSDCTANCVTLKATWVFPDGSTSHCPQKYLGEIAVPEHQQDWDLALQLHEALHRV